MQLVYHTQFFNNLIIYLKQVLSLLKTPLIHIFNLCFKEGIFPRKLKIGKITPSFKKGDSFLLTNYRPITILPCFSKILERLMYNKLYTYLTENNILFNLQFGFRCQHSTEHAIVELVDKILNGFSEEKYTLGVFIDLFIFDLFY